MNGFFCQDEKGGLLLKERSLVFIVMKYFSMLKDLYGILISIIDIVEFDE